MRSTPSASFVSLTSRFRELRNHLLPKNFDLTGTYTPRQFDRTRGYIALVHAEIESYIESKCKDLAAQRVDDWIRNRTPSPVIIALHAICYSGWSGLMPEPQFKLPTNQINVEARLQECRKQYDQVVESNNGIKEENLKKLLVPLSVRMSDINSDWISDMNSLGATRGSIVHQSIGMTTQPDPKETHLNIINQITAGLRDLDLIFQRL